MRVPTVLRTTLVVLQRLPGSYSPDRYLPAATFLAAENTRLCPTALLRTWTRTVVVVPPSGPFTVHLREFADNGKNEGAPGKKNTVSPTTPDVMRLTTPGVEGPTTPGVDRPSTPDVMGRTKPVLISKDELSHQLTDAIRQHVKGFDLGEYVERIDILNDVVSELLDHNHVVASHSHELEHGRPLRLKQLAAIVHGFCRQKKLDAAVVEQLSWQVDICEKLPKIFCRTEEEDKRVTAAYVKVLFNIDGYEHDILIKERAKKNDVSMLHQLESLRIVASFALVLNLYHQTAKSWGRSPFHPSVASYVCVALGRRGEVATDDIKDMDSRLRHEDIFYAQMLRSVQNVLLHAEETPNYKDCRELFGALRRSRHASRGNSG